MKSFVLGGAALLSVAGLSPAVARTHHPSTAAERKQTDDLNAQQLALARGQQPLQQQAAATMPEQNNAMTATPQTSAPESTTPQSSAPESTTPQPTPPSEQQNQPSETPQTNGSSPQQ
jgi:hypothetical protein